MRQQYIEVVVGFFVLLGLLAFMILSLRVSGLTDIYAGKGSYEISADFENIGGLKKRARVTIAGVSVGRVKDIVFDSDTHYAKVTLLIFNNINNLPVGTEAKILTAGLLGDNYIGLLPAQAQSASEILKPGAHLGIESTHKALILEDLIAKFFANTVTNK